jgi:hypothetical protein
MTQVLTIAIPDDVAAELRDLAHREFRNPRGQATVLLIEAIRRQRVETSVDPGGSVAANGRRRAGAA